MAFVQRDATGKITGIWSVRQTPDQEELSDLHPEVIAFNKRYPVPSDFLKPVTEKEWKKHRADVEDMHRERADLIAATDAFRHGFDELETALSTLLHTILDGKKSKIPYAVFYSVTSFEARSSLVENALIEAIAEDKHLKPLSGQTHCPFVWLKIRGIRDMRNHIAHGTPKNLIFKKKIHVRHVAPTFDAIRVGRPFGKGTVPGLTAQDIERGRRPIGPIIMCLDSINQVVAAAREERRPMLQTKYRLLANDLRALRSLYPNVPKKPKQPHQPKPSAASRRKAALERLKRA